MTTATHIVAPEEIMAWLDGELSGVEAASISAHVEECAECAALAGQLRRTHETLAQWTVPDAPPALDSSITERAKNAAAKNLSARPASYTHLSFWNWRLWAIGGAGAVAVVLVLAAVLSPVSYHVRHAQAYLNPSEEPAANVGSFALAPPQGESLSVDGQAISDQKSKVVTESKSEALSGRNFSSLVQLAPGVVADSNGLFHGLGDHAKTAFAGDSVSSTSPAPMIARTVSLTILAKDFPAARSSLDAILARHRGYSASLAVNTPANGQGSFQASLRIPSGEVSTALGELKAMGRVLAESQSGEEVTEQHADLVARLANSREEEQRLKAILEQRTGKIEDVLRVEEEIANVRGAIEQMEAEQKALEHRVDFVTVDLQLAQEFRERLGAAGAAPSASTRMYNAMVAGLRHAGGTVLGVVLFLEEFGPPILIWLVLLGIPVFLVWRRYRRMRDEI